MEVLSEREEGEMSDDSSMSIDEEPTTNSTKKPIVVDFDSSCDIIYRAEKGGLIVEKLQKVDTEKIEERAKRFGINLSGNNIVSQKQIDELYDNIGITDSNVRHIRFDTLHLKGIDGLTTKDIFEYLKDYNPIAVERINETSCNVICKDHVSAALAILVSSKDIVDKNIEKIAKNCPPYYWREGLPHPYSDLILIRFATKSDFLALPVKDEQRFKNVAPKDNNESSTKNPWGPLCQTWGVYDHQEVYVRSHQNKSYINTESGLFRVKPKNIENRLGIPQVLRSTTLASRLGKRQIKYESIDDESSDEEWKIKSKIPRMRMRADDEEKKTKSHHPAVINNDVAGDSHPPLSIQIDNTDDTNSGGCNYKTPLSDKFSKRLHRHLDQQKTNIHSRLGERVEFNTKDKSDGESSDDSCESHVVTNIMSRVQKAPVRTEKKRPSSTVWKRLDKTTDQSDLRHTMKPSDLRTKLKECKRRSPLRIEVDNEYYESD